MLQGGAFDASGAAAFIARPGARDAVLLRQWDDLGKQQGLATPDARDVADGRGAWKSPQVTIVKVPQPTQSASGFDWGDAGIGAGAVTGLMLLALGTGLAIVHRRQRGRAPRRPATAA